MTWAEHMRRSNGFLYAEIAVILGGLIGITIAAVALIFTVTELQEARESRDTEAIARNWTILTTKASGNRGKIKALEYLASKKQSLRSIDLSCKTMGGTDKSENNKDICKRPTFLQRLDLSTYTHDYRVMLYGADLSGADLRDANLSGAYVADADLSGTNLWNADLSSAYIKRADLSEANLSGTIFPNAGDLRIVNFQNAWAWTDREPIDLGIDKFGIDLYVHDGNQGRSIRPDPCIAP